MQIRQPLRRVLSTLALALVAAPVIATVASTQGVAETGALHVIGSLPAVKGVQRRPGFQQTIVAVDPAGRRLFVLHPGVDNVLYLVTYSLKTRIPHQIGIGKAGVLGDYPIANQYTATFDSKRGNVAMLSSAMDLGAQSTQSDTGNITIYNDAQHKVVAHWNFHDRVPGFYAMGITYAPQDDLYYAIGEFSGQRFLADGTPVFGSKPVGPMSAIVAFNAQTGAVQFVKPIPECQQVLYSKGIGSLVARGSGQSAVYFACVTGGTAAGQTYPGQAGLVRATVSATGNTAAAAQWPIDFFPISGNYFAGGSGSGVAAFDRTVDRFYLQSISFRTPGAFVFDGRLSAWVGFVAATVPLDYFNGLNEGLGHFYMGVTSGSTDTADDVLIVADVRQTPVPAGEAAPMSTSALISADAKSNRLFVRPKDANAPYLVVEDLTEVTKGDAEEDYDADTTDTPDTPAADVFYGIGANGYGAQVVQVGGGSSPVTMLGPISSLLPKIAQNTRAIMTSRAGAIDLRTSGASASTQAALPDYNTIGEYEKQYGAWPYEVTSCLDAGGEPATMEARSKGPAGPANGDYVSVSCDLEKNVVTAVARYGAASSGATTISKSTYDAKAYRNRAEGAVVTTRATASGVSIDVPGGQEVRFGAVTSSTKSVSHGRPGTATSVWTRSVDGVQVVDPTGNPVFTAPGCSSRVEAGKPPVDTCGPLAATLSRLLQTRFRLAFPMPEVDATPKGAFAGVEQGKAEYFNQSVVNEQGVVYRGDSVGLRPTPALVAEVYNDTTERSRTVTSLAATQGYTIFTVAPAYDDGWTPTDPGVPTSDGTSGEAPGVTPTGTGSIGTPGAVGAPQTPTVPAGAATIPVADVRGWLFMRRSLKDIALLLLLSGIVLGGMGTAVRRRRLIEVLNTVPGKETSL